MRIQVVTIFPQLFEAFLETSLVGRAVAARRLLIEISDLREFTDDRHRTVDDEPYGGGGGMVMTAPPWLAAVERLWCGFETGERGRRILLSPQGTVLDDRKVRELASLDRLLLMCGRYEGIDDRVRQLVVDEEISIGDYVLSGGELAAMVVIETVSRQIPGVVGQPDSVENDSFRVGLLDYPHYTRPPEVAGLEVPTVLRSGNHEKIAHYRRSEALRATWQKRPELLERTTLSVEERKLLEKWRRQAEPD